MTPLGIAPVSSVLIICISTSSRALLSTHVSCHEITFRFPNVHLTEQSSDAVVCTCLVQCLTSASEAHHPRTAAGSSPVVSCASVTPCQRTASAHSRTFHTSSLLGPTRLFAHHSARLFTHSSRLVSISSDFSDKQYLKSAHLYVQSRYVPCRYRFRSCGPRA